MSLRNLAMSFGMVGSFLMVKQCFELLEGEGEPVVEIVGSEDAGIEVTLAHDAEVLGAALILFRVYQFKVARTIVEFITVDVIDLHAGCPCSVEGDVHEMMAEFITIIAHFRVLTSALIFLHGTIKFVFYFLPFRVDEKAVGVCP